MTMEEFADMVKAVKDAKAIVGEVKYGPTDGEQGNLKFRRSLFVVKDIPAGAVITEEKIRSIRPSTGVKPKFYSELLGKKAKVDIKFGEPLKLDLFE